MKPLFTLLLSIGWLTMAASWTHAASPNLAPAVAPDILVVRDGWEEDRDTVRAVLESAAGELWKYVPNRPLPPIVVYPQGGPMTLYQRGPDGEIFVHLASRGSYWAQYAFQFSHEFCHILSNYREEEHDHSWFEEALCELASLFVLRRMSETWTTSPPFEESEDFAPALAEYAANRVSGARLKPGQALSAWYAAYRLEHDDPLHDRHLHRVVAVALLGLFEEAPSRWAAIATLNGNEPETSRTLQEYFDGWSRRTPPRHRPVIGEIARLLVPSAE